MTQSQFFKFLGAPLANQRWSWGAVRPSDGSVFLRVWQDEIRKVDGRKFVMVSANNHFREKEDSLGYKERLAHVELIRSGKPSYLVMCVAVDVNAAPRTIAKFDRDDLWVGGQLLDMDNDTWLELADRRRVAEVRTQQPVAAGREGDSASIQVTAARRSTRRLGRTSK